MIVAAMIIGIIMATLAFSLYTFSRFNDYQLVTQHCIAAARAQLDSITATTKPIPHEDFQRLWPKLTISMETSPGTGQWQGMNLAKVTAAGKSYRRQVKVQLSRYVRSQLFNTVVLEIPRASRVVRENTTVLDVIEHISRDIDRAKGLPRASGDYTAGDTILLIQLPDTMICYEITEDKILRRDLGEDPQTSSAWTTPNANVKWRVWRKDNVAYAVEIITHVVHKWKTKQQKKMAGSHLYFVGAL